MTNQTVIEILTISLNFHIPNHGGYPLASSDFEIEMSLYKLEKCGLYESTLQGNQQRILRNEPAKALLIDELLREIKKWAVDSDRPFGNTCPSGIADSSRIYCYNITEYKGTFLAAFWVAMAKGKNSINKLSRSKPIKNVVPTDAKANLTDDDIAGYMAYFIFVPEKNRFAPVQLRHIGTDKNPVSTPKMKAYLNAYINYETGYLMKEDGGSSFSEKPKGTEGRVPNSNLVSRLEWSRETGDPELQVVKDKSRDIYKLTYKFRQPEKIMNHANSKLNYFRQMFADFKLGNDDLDNRKEMEVVIPILNGLDVSEIIELENNFEEFSEGEAFNVGFKIHKDPKEYWLDKTYRKFSDKMSVQTEAKNREFPVLLDLHKKLFDKAGSFLNS